MIQIFNQSITTEMFTCKNPVQKSEWAMSWFWCTSFAHLIRFNSLIWKRRQRLPAATATTATQITHFLVLCKHAMDLTQTIHVHRCCSCILTCVQNFNVVCHIFRVITIIIYKLQNVGEQTKISKRTENYTRLQYNSYESRYAQVRCAK